MIRLLCVLLSFVSVDPAWGQQPPAQATQPFAKSHVKWPTTDPRLASTTGWHVGPLSTVYGIPTNLPGGGVIGILELGGGWRQRDLDQFAVLNSMPKFTATDVSVDGATNSPGDDADAEVALDIQVAACAYYKATGKIPQIRVYWLNNTTDAFSVGVKRAAADGCSVFSISWGAPESQWGAASLRTLEAAASAALAQGMVTFAASGDNSSGDGTSQATVDAPACCPSIVGCGGTYKDTSNERVWGNGTRRGSGTGGGFSRVFQVPQYQTPFLPKATGRMVPDLAAVADPQSGYLIVLGGNEVKIGGTSGVSPYYSGLVAACGSKVGAGFHAKIWPSAVAFTDITTGSNGDYKAAAGPDPCTGKGVPASALAALLTGGGTIPPPLPPVDPGKGFTGDVTVSATFSFVNGKVTGVKATPVAAVSPAIEKAVADLRSLKDRMANDLADAQAKGRAIDIAAWLAAIEAILKLFGKG